MNAAPFVISASLVNIHRDPDRDSELVTQALLNEPVWIKQTSAEWIYVELVDYHGWMLRSQQGDPPSDFDQMTLDHPYAVVHVPHAPLYKHAQGAEELDTLYLSTALPLLADASMDRYYVALPHGRSGWLAQQSVVLHPAACYYPPQPVAVVTAHARAFRDVPYLWGGRSWHGIDCSALVQLCYRMGGYQLPRDADQQCDALGDTDLSAEEMRAGDLVFFGQERVTHVGLALDNTHYIHAEGQRFNRVMIHSVDSTDECYDHYLAQRVRTRKRVIHSS